MIEVKKQDLAAIQQAQTKEVVVDEGRKGIDHDVKQTESTAALSDRDLGTQRRIAVHVADVAFKRGIGAVKQGVAERAGGTIHLNYLMHRPIREAALAAAEQAQLAVWIKTAVAY